MYWNKNISLDVEIITKYIVIYIISSVDSSEGNWKHTLFILKHHISSTEAFVTGWGGVELTSRWRWTCFWRDLWVKGQSRSRSGRGRTPAAGYEESWPVGPDLSQDWPGGPGGCVPQIVHSPRQNWEETRQRGLMKETITDQTCSFYDTAWRQWKEQLHPRHQRGITLLTNYYFKV